jgi:hypothetical protein
MLAVKMLAQVHDELGLELGLGAVFDHSTIRGLAASLTAELLGDVSDAEVASLLSELEGSDS